MRKAVLVAAASGLSMAVGVSVPVSAAPVGTGALAAATERAAPAGGLETVHYRPYRHCHWRYGRRWCHGPHYYGYYGYGPGWGGSYRHHHWKKKHYHHHKHWKKKH